jgi:hypothetical protein
MTVDITNGHTKNNGGKFYISLRVKEGYDLNMKDDRGWSTIGAEVPSGFYAGYSGFVDQVSVHYGKEKGSSMYVVGLAGMALGFVVYPPPIGVFG